MSPAHDRPPVQGDEAKLREALADWLANDLFDENTDAHHYRYADAILAGPIRPLLDANEALNRRVVELEADAFALAANQYEGPMTGDERGHSFCPLLTDAQATVARLTAENERLRSEADSALKKAIRAWSHRLHIPVTRMMSRALRDDFKATLNEGGDDAQR